MKFPASSAHRWMVCPGSYRIMREAPWERGGDAAQRGTAVHSIIEQEIKLKTFDARQYLGGYVYMDTAGNTLSVNDPASETDKTYYRKFEICETMVRGAQICLDLVKSIMDKRPNAFVYTEIRSEVIPGEVGGTSDIVIVDGSWGAVIDYKNGRGHVDVEDNKQLQIYACGVSKLYPSVENWTLGIVQPNDSEDRNPVRTWKTNTQDLGAFELDTKATVQMCKEACDNADDPKWYNPGNHCRWCPGEKTCVAMRQMTLQALGSELPDLPPIGDPGVKPVPVSELSNDQLAWALEYRKLMVNYLDKELPAEAVKRGLAGQVIPGRKLVRKRTNRKVTNESGLMDAAEANGWDIWADPKIAPLSQLDKQVPKMELAKYVSKPEGDIEIAPKSDKRPEIETTKGL